VSTPFAFRGSIGSIKFEGPAPGGALFSPCLSRPSDIELGILTREGLTPRAIFIPRFGGLRSLFIQPLGNAPVGRGVTESPWQLRIPPSGNSFAPRAPSTSRVQLQGTRKDADENFTPVVARAISLSSSTINRPHPLRLLLRDGYRTENRKGNHRPVW
jgi:hypothetical protein